MSLKFGLVLVVAFGIFQIFSSFKLHLLGPLKYLENCQMKVIAEMKFHNLLNFRIIDVVLIRLFLKFLL